MPMTTNLDRLVTYHEKFSPKKSHDTLITLTCNIICDKLKPLYLLNLAGC